MVPCGYVLPRKNAGMTRINGNKVLTKSQCDVLRGLAIIGIFLHNFCHWLPGSNKENEYTFLLGRSNSMWNYWTGGGIDHFFPIQFFSFFGHYGVPLFLFLSGYGLVLKYEREGAARVKTLPFLGYHWLKLFRLMILGFLLSVLAYNVLCNLEPHPWNEVVSQLTMVVNLIFTDPGGALLPGPYWFFGLMLEVYIIYRLLIYPSHDKSNSVWRWLTPLLLIIVSWLFMATQEANVSTLNYLRYNATVAMLPFGMGILVARYGMPKLSKPALAIIAVVSIPAMAVFNLNYQSWLWTPAVVIAGAVAFVLLFDSLSRRASGVVMKPLAWFGAMSSSIFVVHSIPRIPMFKFVLWRQHELALSNYWWLIAYIVLTLVLAWLYNQYLKLIPSPRLKDGKTITFSK